MRPNVLFGWRRPNARQNAFERSHGCARAIARRTELLARMRWNAHLTAPERPRGASERPRHAPEYPPECAPMSTRMRPKGRTIRTNAHRNAPKLIVGQARAYGRMRPKVPAMRSNSHQNAHECSPDRARTFARCARIDARRAIMFSRMHLNACPNAPDRSRDAPEHSRDAPECLHECARMFSRFLQKHRLHAPESSCVCIC